MKSFRLSVLFIFILLSCSDRELDQETFSSVNNVEKQILKSPSLSTDYFNTFLKSQGLGATIVKDVTYGLLSKKILKSAIYQKSKQLYDLSNTVSIALVVKSKNVISYVLPRKDNPFRADIYFETDGIVSEEVLEIDIINHEESLKVTWKKKGNYKNSAFFEKNSEECTSFIISCDCEEGAADIQKIGGIIAFAGFFGCVFCPFVGFAIATVAATISLGC